MIHIKLKAIYLMVKIELFNIKFTINLLDYKVLLTWKEYTKS